jgi:MFS transporter, FHS family, glucose/mannose:H+ symporter
MSPGTSSQPPFRRAPLLVALNACMFVFGMILLLMGSLLPTLQASGTRAGGLGSMPLIGILAATILIGPVLDKGGAKPALAVSLALILSAMMAMPSLGSYAALAAAALVYGFGGGVLNTATNALVSDLSGAGRSVALNLLGFSFSLGAITSPLVTSWTAERWPGPAVLRVLALAPAAVLVLVLPLRFPAPASSSVPLRKLLAVLRHPLVWLIGALLFFESGNENCMFVWAGKVMGDVLHLPVSRAELALAALSVALGAGRLLAALAALTLKWLGSRNTLLISVALTMAGAGLLHQTFHGMVTGFAVIGLGTSAIFPTGLALAGDRFPDEPGTVFGAVMAVALVGGAAGPAVGGWAAGFRPSAVLLVPLAGAAAIAILTLIVSGLEP